MSWRGFCSNSLRHTQRENRCEMVRELGIALRNNVSLSKAPRFQSHLCS